MLAAVSVATTQCLTPHMSKILTVLRLVQPLQGFLWDQACPKGNMGQKQLKLRPQGTSHPASPYPHRFSHTGPAFGTSGVLLCFPCGKCHGSSQPAEIGSITRAS